MDTKDKMTTLKTTKETSIKMNEEGAFNLDGILGELGSFGKYQLLLLLLLSFRDTFLSMCNFNYVFTAAEVPYRCRVPECESNEPSFNSPWIQFALPNTTNTCYRMAPYFGPVNETSVADHTTGSHEDNLTVPWLHKEHCRPRDFDAVKTVPCDDIVYEDYNSVVAEFNLGCDPWKRTLIGTVHNLGLVITFVISGLISDRYGRKVVIVGTPLVVGVMGLLKSFSVSYWMLLILEFLETALGYGNASMVLSLEVVTQNSRVMFSCISDILSSFGSAFFGLIAWKIPYWRHMMRAIYAPLLVVVFYIFLVDEGVRWLLAHNKKDEAVRVLNKVAKYNNITLSNTAKDMLTKITEEKSRVDKLNEERKEEGLRLFSVLRSRTIALRVALMAVAFLCSNFVYTGVIVNSTSISGNKYLNYSILMMMSVPTRIITALTLNRFGRKAPICLAYLLCCGFFLASAFVPKSVWWASTAFYLAGKMCSSYGLFSVHVVAIEVFPTTSRNFLTNVANTVGRLGGVIAPQTPLLERYMSGLPSVVFALVALVTAALALLLPDTSRSALPDDIISAERLDKQNSNLQDKTQKA